MPLKKIFELNLKENTFISTPIGKPSFSIDFIEGTISFIGVEKDVSTKNTFTMDTLEAKLLKYITENASVKFADENDSTLPVSSTDILLYLEANEPEYDYDDPVLLRNAKNRINTKFKKLFGTTDVIMYMRRKYWINPMYEVKIIR